MQPYKNSMVPRRCEASFNQFQKEKEMWSLRKLYDVASGWLTSRFTDKEVEEIQGSVKALNYELSLLRYRDSDDDDIRLAYEYLLKRSCCTALFPYEKMREMSPAEIQFDKDLKMYYVMHNGHRLYYPKGVTEKIVRWLYRYAIEDDDVVGSGYRQRNPHAYQSERYHIQEGDVLIDAGGGKCLSPSAVVEDLIDKVSEALPKQKRNGEWDVELDIGSPRGLFALDVIDKVSKVYMVERTPHWHKPIEATFAPYKDKVELLKGRLASKKQEIQKEKTKKFHLADLLAQCGQRRAFVVLDIEGKELDVLKDAQEYLREAKHPITLAVCAYHHPTDYDDLMHFFETIGYHTETQHGYIYTNMYDDHGIYSLRKGMIRAANY